MFWVPKRNVGKAVGMGRDRRNERSTEHFTKMLRSTLETAAWRALGSTAQALYPWLKFEWRGPQANNNGRIRLSVRQAADRIGVTRNTAARAFHELQAKGFIAVTEGARLGSSGNAKGPTYEITDIELPHGRRRGGRTLFTKWTEGNDFPILKAAPNNSQGRNGKIKSRHQDDDADVIELRTTNAARSQKP